MQNFEKILKYMSRNSWNIKIFFRILFARENIANPNFSCNSSSSSFINFLWGSLFYMKLIIVWSVRLIRFKNIFDHFFNYIPL